MGNISAAQPRLWEKILPCGPGRGGDIILRLGARFDAIGAKEFNPAVQCWVGKEIELSPVPDPRRAPSLRLLGVVAGTADVELGFSPEMSGARKSAYI
jgi:hypothetical protein